VFEKFADYWNKDNVFIDKIVYLPIVDATVRLANLKSGGLDIAERMLATDIKDIRADPKLRLATALELGYQGITINMGDNERAKATPLKRCVTADDVAEIERFCKAQLARYKVPRAYFWVDSLPRNAMGKVQHFRLKDATAAPAKPPSCDTEPS